MIYNKNFIFIGNANISLEILKHLYKHNVFPKAIFSEKKKKFNNDYIDLTKVKIFGKSKKYLTKNINSEKNINIIKKIKPLFIICIGFNSILSKELINIPKLGCVGFHPTNIPFNRGNSPIIWTILLGLNYSYCSFFKLTTEVDKGPVLIMKKIKMNKKTSSTLLYKNIINITNKEIINLIKNIDKYLLKNKILSIYKNRKIKSNIWRKRTFSDGIVDWRMKAEDIYRLCLALQKPYPNSVFNYNNDYYSIRKCKIDFRKLVNIEPGKIIEFNSKSFTIKCSDYLIKVLDYHPKINFKLKKIKYL